MCHDVPAQERSARQVLLATPTGKRPGRHPRTRWSDYISDLARPRFGVELVELSEVAVDRDVFRVPGLLPPGLSPEEKRYENE